ncbi:MAG: 2-oxoacid:acceptor oxidoreductase family protein [gamma proteobacterium symbiont of Bathyaustriella thionipta]|nr:2-oxoacid:acceptor oxidoreductase family protein [gamma proteobacterium symbiont of Bathyaustriella thionipta]MCU7950276.1 2-oxoacid:acceptor oxidoreductase family protein [gamma proteobacterium symbiont of Bathyaustriella thionipta]MCU7952344.1 2-oxoacid:acceptor oxidoreductase family protein [gamma proteobacterium symbiont of Bathyaustriella thionipta]MCU7956793.1 2-oxoacid:acceptor oxidoreductase family protein [gamma proteobacterium symbiont of Bathyaustriella thionipta]MCU7968308.1 2-ox
MFQIRIHGRGGQGVVSASELLSVAAFEEGKYSQSFPSFGSERMGAPVQAFARISDKNITIREPVMNPDMLIIQDPTLFQAVNVFDGAKTDGYLLINSSKTVEQLGIDEISSQYPKNHVMILPATELAVKYIKQPKPNTVLLGAFAALSHMVKIPALENAIRGKFAKKIADPNIAATTAGYNFVMNYLQQKTQKQGA